MKRVYPKANPDAKPDRDFAGEMDELCRAKVAQLVQCYLEAEVDELLARRLRYERRDQSVALMHWARQVRNGEAHPGEDEIAADERTSAKVTAEVSARVWGLPKAQLGSRARIEGSNQELVRRKLEAALARSTQIALRAMQRSEHAVPWEHTSPPDIRHATPLA